MLLSKYLLPVLLTLLPVAAVAEPLLPSDVCQKTQPLTLTGKIGALQVMREEPQAEQESYFDLELAKPLCGTTTLKASVIGATACRNGDIATMRGEFSPPEEIFNTARLRGEIVSCSP
jgi:hypothetical protein